MKDTKLTWILKFSLISGDIADQLLFLILILTIFPAINSYPSHLKYPNNDPDGEKKVVKIRSMPKDADLVIDGEKFGKTDAEILLHPGNHIIILKKESYLSLSSSIEVKERGNEFSFDLTPKLGWMDLSVRPSDANVIINDSSYKDFETKLLGLSPGKNNILLEKDGYLPERDSLNIIVSDKATRVYNLMPAPEIQVQSENKSVKLKYMDLLLDSWDLSELSEKLPEKDFVIKIRDDASVPQEYKGTAKTLFGNIYQNGRSISLNITQAGENKTLKKRTEYSVILKPRSKFKSIMESAICPGLGQINCQRILTGTAISTAFVGAVIWNAFSLTDFYGTKARINDDISTFEKETDGYKKYQLAKEIDSDYSGLHVKGTKANLTLAILGAVYAINILDALFMTPRVKEAELEQIKFPDISVKSGNYFNSYSISIINIRL